MPFENLTTDQTKLLTEMVSALESGNYENNFHVSCGLRDCSIVIIGSNDNPGKEIIINSKRPILKLADEGYINIDNPYANSFYGSINQKAINEYKDMKTSKPKIFISYQSGDYDQVKEIVDRLESDGHICFIDKRSILGGEEWEKEIFDGIRESDVLIVYATENINDSFWVFLEIELARFSGIPIIFLKTEDFVFPGHMQHLINIQYIEENDYQQLVSSLEVIESKEAFWETSADSPENIDNIRRLISLAYKNQDDRNPCYNLGNYYRTIEKDFAKAIYWYIEAIRRNPDESSAYDRIAEMYEDTKQIEQAIIWFERSANADKGNNYPCEKLGLIYRDTANQKLALKWFEECIKRQPSGYSNCYDRVAEIAYKDKDFEKSIEYFKMSAVVSPNNDWPCNKLADIYKNDLRNDEEAEKWEQEAKRRKPI